MNSFHLNECFDGIYWGQEFPEVPGTVWLKTDQECLIHPDSN